jgi:hypothetical protein
MRVDSNASYVIDVLPACSIFGLGLSATVAPLTATALNSVAENRVGVASGINNAVSRVAGVLAIAVLGAVVAGSSHPPSTATSPAKLSPQAEQAISKAKDNPLQRPDTKACTGGGR